ncbi:hypothetical protein SRB17_88550 [Streptomyces sp. RB17]|uniref:hypothetical protein n=1 Tax=Streptomyces sp. RB17 TaxID=2585197 RepID=UPI001294BAD4|nr:hypothetical protein [Streptomyces sp. RB17]MQY40822.1 hypothetical protein [Streptomyces sp. RB17]
MSSVPSVAQTHGCRCLAAAFNGDMDYLNGPMFRTELLKLVDSGERFIVLVLALLAARRRAHETGARLAPARVQGQLRQLLTLTGVDRILDVYDATEDAVTNLASHRGDNSRNGRNIGPQTRTVSPR